MLKTFLITYQDELYKYYVRVKALHRQSAQKKVQALNPDINIESCKYVKG